MWFKRWIWKLLKLWAVCVTSYVACVGLWLVLVRSEIMSKEGLVAAVLAAVGFVSFCLLPVSLIAFLILSGQRYLYSILPEHTRARVFWIKWLEDRERARETLPRQ